MDSQQIGNPQDPHTAGYSVLEGEDDQQHHEKKSVMKKVKAKAKKMKSSFAKRARGHGGHDHHDDEHSPHQEDEGERGPESPDYDEDDDDDDYDDAHDNEKMVESPKVHATPKVEPTAIKNDVPVAVNKGEPWVGFGTEDGIPQTPASTPVTETNQTTVNEPEGNQGPIKDDSGRSTVLEEDFHTPKGRPEAQDPANYQTKLPYPTSGGAEEAAGITPILNSFGKMSVNDQDPPIDQHILQTGNHDPELPPSTKADSEQTHDDSITNESPENQSSGSSYTDKLSFATSAVTGRAMSVKNVVASKLGYGGKDDNAVSESQESGEREMPGTHDQLSPELSLSTKTNSDQPQNTKESPQNQSSSYTDKLSFATSALTGRALSSKNVVASKLGYGGKDDNAVSESQESGEREMPGTHDQLSPELSLSTKTNSDQPQDDSYTKESPQNQSSSYTDKLSFATSALTGRALSAKNVVASKLGYGGKDENAVPESHESEERGIAPELSPPAKTDSDQFFPELSPPTKTDSDQFSRERSSPTKTDSEQPHDESNTKESPKKQSGSYTEKLSFATSAITGRALSAKNVVASKLGYGGKDDNAVTESRESEETETPKSPSSPSQADGYGKKIASTVTGTLSPVYSRVASAGTTVMSKVTGSGTGTGSGTEDVTDKVPDKGVSMTQYLAEKLKPGEEDKALSKAISTSLYKSKEEGSEHREEKPMGKVTESEEVAKRLGTGEDYSEGGRADSGQVKLNSGDASDVNVNKGMVNSVKGVVSSWFGKGEVGNGQEKTEERKLQESSN